MGDVTGSAPAATVDEAAAFVAKWRGAWPEWSLVEGFVPPGEREAGPAWQALQFELQEAAWAGGDARPGEAKLAWWAEELSGWAQGRRRHPLGAVLQRYPAPWTALANALPGLAASRMRPATAGHAWGGVADAAAAAAAVEAALLGGRADARAVAAGWLHARLARHPADAVPADQAAPAAWADSLLRQWPESRGLSATRRIELALARARLAKADAASPRAPLAVLWAGWRAARG